MTATTEGSAPQTGQQPPVPSTRIAQPAPQPAGPAPFPKSAPGQTAPKQRRTRRPSGPTPTPGASAQTQTNTAAAFPNAQLRVSGRRKQSPLLLVLALLLVLGSAGVFGALYLSAGDRLELLVAKDNIPAGTIIKAEHLGVAEVAGSGFNGVASSDARALVGAVANRGISKGSLVTKGDFVMSPTIPEGYVATGLALENDQFPVELRSERNVQVLDRVFEGVPSSTVVVESAYVLSRTDLKDDVTLVTVVLTHADAERVSALGKRTVLTLHPEDNTKK